MRKNIYFKIIVSFLAIFNLFIGPIETIACSRILYTSGKIVMTGRTTDWNGNVNTNIWLLPRGLEKNGSAGENSLVWKAKYGSVISTVHDMFSLDGMNEKGLVINLLYLKESKYYKPKNNNENKKSLLVSAWGQYILDNFATVKEAVKEFEKGEIYIVPFEIDDSFSHNSGLHLSISDSKGDSAIFEYIDGKLKIYHNKEYKVMTNSPIYNEQLALNEYWKNIGGEDFLPGTHKSQDRFVRGSFYNNTVEKTNDHKKALSIVLSVIRNISVPIGISTPKEPNLSSTLWRSVSDQTNKIYYFESVYEQNGFYIDLKKVDFSSKQPVKKLDLSNGKYYYGEVNNKFIDSEMFNFSIDLNSIK